MNSIVLLPAQQQDVPAISSILLDAFLEYRFQYTEQGFNATTPNPTEILRRLEEGPVWLALIDGEAVGTVSAVMQDLGVLYVRGMAVLPSARGAGIGTLLFQEVDRYAIEHDCNRLLLSTTPFLHRAIKLYEKLGFVRIDQGEQDLYGTPLFTMEKLL